MYVGNNLGSFGGLNSYWGDADKEPEVSTSETAGAIKKRLDPRDVISKPRERISAFEAMQFLMPYGKKLPEGGSQQKEGKVYWTQVGPLYSRKPVKEGSSAEKVPPPAIKLKPNVKVVRDMPVLKNLNPVEIPELPSKAKAQALEGISDKLNWCTAIISLQVLSLLIYLLYSYNKS